MLFHLSRYFRSRQFRLGAALSACAIVMLTHLPLSATATVTLSGAGATFPTPLYERYIKAFEQTADIKVTYQGVGSGAGIRQFVNDMVDFGGSDAAMLDRDLKQVKRGTILVPTAGGAVAVIYNLPSVNNLNLSRTVLPDIFSGKITRWNDPRIAQDNPGVNLPNADIKTVVRADSSATTFIFTNHLATVSADFKRLVGRGTAPKWPGNPLKGTTTYAGLVRQTVGSIGYGAFAFAKSSNLPIAAVQDQQGNFMQPSVESANAAIASIDLKAANKFRVFEGNPTKGYPIVGLTWLMVYKNYPEPQKAAAIKLWIRWILTEGQKINGDLGYTRIPPSVAEQILQVVEREVKS